MTIKIEPRIKALALALAWLVAGLGTASAGHAEPEAPLADPISPSPVTLRGFGTLGLARSTSDRVEFVRDLSQPGGTGGFWTSRIDTLLGVQGNLRVSDHLEGVAQVVSRYGSRGNYDPELIWAFGKFDPNANLSLRLGRLGTDFFMLADSRLVGYSYLTVRPPGDYYGTLPFQHIDGADAVVTVPVNGGLLRGKFYTGQLDEKIASMDSQWNLRGSHLGGGHVDYQHGSWLWRLGYAELRFKNSIPALDTLAAQLLPAIPTAAAPMNALSVKDKLSRFYSAGIVYDHGPLQVQLMLNRIRQESALLPDSRAGYLIAGYRVSEWTPFAGYSRVDSDHKQLPASGMAGLDAKLALELLNRRSDQHTSFAGLRWDFRPNAALKVQYDAIRSTPTSLFPYRRQKHWNDRTDVFSLTLDFVF
jgi:hypothetical protein